MKDRRLQIGKVLLLMLGVSILIAGCGQILDDGEKGSTELDGDTRRELSEASLDTGQWKTNFNKHSVPLTEFASGGPPRDGIPPIDDPKFVSVREADKFLDDKEPVIVVEAGNKARAYPIQILTWHELANDKFADRPILISYCPLCDSALVFDRRVDGKTLTFGTTGNLRKSNLVMWDRQTESWWSQIGGEALVGDLTGKKLKQIPSQTLAWTDYKKRFPKSEVLSRDTGARRNYGSNPYVGYDDPGNKETRGVGSDSRLPAKERVAAVRKGKETVVVPFSALRKKPVLNAKIGDTPIVVFFKRGVKSALDSSDIKDSREVGTAAVFDRRLDDKVLSFKDSGGKFVDRETNSVWDITGKSVSGPLKGKKLKKVPSDNHLWFAVAAFFKDPKIIRP